MKVAWIGLGHMGLPTAKTVAAAGHEVRGFDVSPPNAEDASGLTLVSTPHEAVEGCDVVCIAVYSDAQAEEVLAGPNGVFPALKPGTVVAIFTTGTIGSVQQLAADAPEGVAVLDTCFSRQNHMIPSGELNLLVGGDEAALDRCRPVLEPFAKNIYYMGRSGMGRAIKLVNNILLIGNKFLARDALKLAEGLGLDRIETTNIILKCSGSSDILNMFRNPDVEAMLEYMAPVSAKDATATAEEAGKADLDLGILSVIVEEARRWSADRPIGPRSPAPLPGGAGG